MAITNKSDNLHSSSRPKKIGPSDVIEFLAEHLLRPDLQKAIPELQYELRKMSRACAVPSGNYQALSGTSSANQRGHTTPSGQRKRVSNSRQRSSVGNSRLTSGRVIMSPSLKELSRLSISELSRRILDRMDRQIEQLRNWPDVASVSKKKVPRPSRGKSHTKRKSPSAQRKSITIEWISAEERLPEDGLVVLGWYLGNDGKYRQHVLCYRNWQGCGWVIDGPDGPAKYPKWSSPKITHWMPLPLPPEK